MGLRQRARSATLWSAIQQIGVNGVNTLFTLVFARFLTAEDFGIFAAASLLIGFVTKLAIFGLDTVIVQREEMDRRVLSTAFWATLSAACILAGLLSILSIAFAPFFNDQTLVLLVPLLALGMVANVATTVIGALFRRQLDIKLLTKRTLIAGLCAGVVSVPLAVAGFGLWTLVIHFLATSFLSTIVTILLAGRAVEFAYDHRAGREMLRSGLPIYLTDTLKYFSSESPRIFVALFLSIEALGIFTLATRILTLMLQLTMTPLSMIGIPVFSEINRSDRTRLPEIFAMTLKTLVILVLPVVTLAILLMDGLVRLLLGASWAEVSAPAAILLAGALLLPLPFICDSVLVGIGNSRAYLGFTMLRAVVGAALLLLLTPFGIVYAALAFLLRGVIVEPLLLFFTIRKLDLAPRPIISTILLIYIAAVGTGMLVYMISSMLPDVGYIVRAFISAIVFASGFLLAVRLLAPGNLSALAGLLVGERGSKA